MYRKYPHDLEMQSLDTTERAIENDLIHGKLVSGSVVIACTANVGISQAVNFPIPFSPNTIPDVMFCLTAIGSPTSVIKNLVGALATATGFTIQGLTDTTQSITVTYYAKGITT